MNDIKTLKENCDFLLKEIKLLRKEVNILKEFLSLDTDNFFTENPETIEEVARQTKCW